MNSIYCILYTIYIYRMYTLHIVQCIMCTVNYTHNIVHYTATTILIL